MKKHIFKKAGVFALSAALIMVMSMSSVFAMTDDSTRQTNSSTTATITLEKTLTVDQTGKFPNISDFNFTFERVEAWDNANTSTSANGANINKANIPMPAASSTSHHVIAAVSNSNGDKVSVSAGDYTASATGDTTSAKSRSTDLPITYSKAGYYVYKVNEVNDGATGVTYDSDAYYVCVYVANNMDSSGNTVDGVYVHSITIWQNMSSLTANLNQHSKDIGTDPDNNGTNVANNRVTGNDAEGKVSTTTSAKPNETVVNFDNLSSSKNIILSKNVKGSLGDRTKQFEFTVTLVNLVPGTTYQISDGKTPAAGFALVSASKGTLNTTNKTITAAADGGATFLVKLTDDQAIKIEGLPVGSTYAISEAASDHKASYAVSSDTTGTPAAVIANASASNSAKDTALATSTETVDSTDGTVTVAYTNQRDMATITGVPGLDYMIYVLIGLVLIAGAYAIIRRRRMYADEMCE